MTKRLRLTISTVEITLKARYTQFRKVALSHPAILEFASSVLCYLKNESPEKTHRYSGGFQTITTQPLRVSWSFWHGTKKDLKRLFRTFSLGPHSRDGIRQKFQMVWNPFIKFVMLVIIGFLKRKHTWALFLTDTQKSKHPRLHAKQTCFDQHSH